MPISSVAKGRELEEKVVEVLKSVDIECKWIGWVFSLSYLLSRFVSEVTLPLGVKCLRIWKLFVATACESYQSSIQTWRTVDGLLWTFFPVSESLRNLTRLGFVVNRIHESTNRKLIVAVVTNDCERSSWFLTIMTHVLNFYYLFYLVVLVIKELTSKQKSPGLNSRSNVKTGHVK